MTDQVSIVAGGWSASQLNLARLPGTVIAVNDSARYLPRWDLCLSMDRIWAENRIHWLSKQLKPVYLRRSTMTNIPKLSIVSTFENDHTSTTLSDEIGRLNGTHSGFCALNLAYQMRPRQLFLIGFDMALGPRGERHWFPDYPWKNGGGSSAGKLATWEAQFSIASKQLLAAGIQTYIAGKKSSRWFQPIDRNRLEDEASCAA